MPPQDRRRFNDLDHTEQAWPQPGHPHQQRAIAVPQWQAQRPSPYSDIELMTEKQVLGFEPAPRLEDVADEDQE